MARNISVRGIAVLDGKLLCVRLKSYRSSIAKSSPFWCLPGGGLDMGEALLDGIHREMIEETGVTPKVGRLLYVQQFMHDRRDFLEFFFHIENAKDYAKIDLSQTTHGETEIEEIAFVDPKTTRILPKLLTTEPLADFIASDQPTRFFAYH